MGEFNERILRSITLADLDYLYRYYYTQYNTLTNEEAKSEALRRSNICRNMLERKLGEYERHIFIVPINEYPRQKK